MVRNPLINEYEYRYLKGAWNGVSGAAYNAVGEYCIEMGYTDHFGFVTPAGQEVIDEYENFISGH